MSRDEEIGKRNGSIRIANVCMRSNVELAVCVCLSVSVDFFESIDLEQRFGGVVKMFNSESGLARGDLILIIAAVLQCNSLKVNFHFGSFSECGAALVALVPRTVGPSMLSLSVSSSLLSDTIH